MTNISSIFPNPSEDKTILPEPPRNDLVDRSLPATKDDLLRNLTNGLSSFPENTYYYEELLKRNISGTKINYTPSNPQVGDQFKSKASGVIITLTPLSETEKKEDDKLYDYGTDQDIYGIPNGNNKKITKEHLQTCFEPVLNDQQQRILQIFSELGVEINTLFPSIHDIFEISPEKANIFRHNLAKLTLWYKKGIITVKGHHSPYPLIHYQCPRLEIENHRDYNKFSFNPNQLEDINLGAEFIAHFNFKDELLPPNLSEINHQLESKETYLTDIQSKIVNESDSTNKENLEKLYYISKTARNKIIHTYFIDLSTSGLLTPYSLSNISEFIEAIEEQVFDMLHCNFIDNKFDNPYGTYLDFNWNQFNQDFQKRKETSLLPPYIINKTQEVINKHTNELNGNKKNLDF